MRNLLIRWFVNTVALFAAAWLVPGVHAGNLGVAIVAALIFGLLNALVRPLLVLLSCPLMVLTLGLFTLVINAAMLKLVSDLVPGFAIESFGAAFLGALVISLTSWVLNLFVNGDGTFIFIKRIHKDGDRGMRK